MIDKKRCAAAKKKAQTELLGMAIVVVLLSLGIMLILVYSSKETPSQLKEMNDEVADKFIKAMLDTTTDCDPEVPFNMQDLILDVVEYRPYGSITCSDGRTSYEYLNSSLEYITNNSVNLWKSGKYQFKIYINDNVPIFFFGTKTCMGKTGKEYPNSLKGIPVYITLHICS